MKKTLFLITITLLLGCNNNNPIEKKEKTTNEISTIRDNEKQLDFEKLSFSQFETIPLREGIHYHGVQGNMIYFSVFEATNATTYSTKELYTYNTKTNEIKSIKKINNEYRVWDYVLLENGKIVYSKIEVGANELSPNKISIVMYDGIEETLIDSGYQYNHLNTATFSITDGKVYYLLEKIDYNETTNQADFLIGSFNEIVGTNAKNIWTSKTEVTDHQIQKGGEVLSTTVLGKSRYASAYFTQTISNADQKSTIYYINNGEFHSIKLDGFVDSVVPLEDFLIVNMSGKNIMIDMKSEVITPISGLGSTIAQGQHIRDNSFMFIGDENISYYASIKKNKISLSRLSGIRSGLLPSFITDGHSEAFAVGYFDIIAADSEDSYIENEIYHLKMDCIIK